MLICFAVLLSYLALCRWKIKVFEDRVYGQYEDPVDFMHGSTSRGESLYNVFIVLNDFEISLAILQHIYQISTWNFIGGLVSVRKALHWLWSYCPLILRILYLHKLHNHEILSFLISSGWCVIINNKDFYQSGPDSQLMPVRNGTDKDAGASTFILDTSRKWSKKYWSDLLYQGIILFSVQ